MGLRAKPAITHASLRCTWASLDSLSPAPQSHATQSRTFHYALLPTPYGAVQNDLDLGSSGAIVIKDKYIMTGGKQGPLYLADAANLGGYSPTTNNANAFQARPPILGLLYPIPE